MFQCFEEYTSREFGSLNFEEKSLEIAQILAFLDREKCGNLSGMHYGLQQSLMLCSTNITVGSSW